MLSGPEIVSMKDGSSPQGKAPSTHVIAALRARGYDVFSSDECVYRQDGIFPRSSSKSAILVAMMGPKYEGNEVLVSYHYWGGFSVCSGAQGKAPSTHVIAALRARGYDVFSSDECVYRQDGIFPRSSSKSAILVA